MPCKKVLKQQVIFLTRKTLQRTPVFGRGSDILRLHSTVAYLQKYL